MATIEYLDKAGLENVLSKVAPITGSAYLSCSSISENDRVYNAVTVVGPANWSLAVFYFTNVGITGQSDIGVSFNTTLSAGEISGAGTLPSSVSSDFSITETYEERVLIVFRTSNTTSDLYWFVFDPNSTSAALPLRVNHLEKNGAHQNRFTFFSTGEGSSASSGTVYYSIH